MYIYSTSVGVSAGRMGAVVLVGVEAVAVISVSEILLSRVNHAVDTNNVHSSFRIDPSLYTLLDQRRVHRPGLVLVMYGT